MAKLTLLKKYYYKKGVKNIKSPNKKGLDKLTWLKKFRKNPQLKKGNKIYLLIKNLRSKRPLRKLDYIKIKPFLINK